MISNKFLFIFSAASKKLVHSAREMAFDGVYINAYIDAEYQRVQGIFLKLIRESESIHHQDCDILFRVLRGGVNNFRGPEPYTKHRENQFSDHKGVKGTSKLNDPMSKSYPKIEKENTTIFPQLIVVISTSERHIYSQLCEQSVSQSPIIVFNCYINNREETSTPKKKLLKKFTSIWSLSPIVNFPHPKSTPQQYMTINPTNFNSACLVMLFMLNEITGYFGYVMLYTKIISTMIIDDTIDMMKKIKR